MWQLNQRNYPTMKIGDSKWTIAQKGCVITSLSALSEWYAKEFGGKATMPDKLVKQLKFTSDGLLLWKSVDDSELPFKFDWRGYTPNNDVVKNILKSPSDSCIVNVNNKAHWVAVVGYSNIFGFKIFDPYYGDIVYLNKRYKGGINGWAEFSLK